MAQIDDNVKAYAKNVKVRTALIFGGVSRHKRVAKSGAVRAAPERLSTVHQGLLSGGIEFWSWMRPHDARRASFTTSGASLRCS